MAEDTGCLEENLIYIKRYHSQIESFLDFDLKFDDFAIVDSKSKDAVLCYQGIPLNNEDDPIARAQKLLASVIDKDDEDAIHILIGIGTGYDLKIFVNNLKGKIILLEPRKEILKMALILVDFSDDFCKHNMVLATNANEVIETIAGIYSKNSKFTFTAIDSYEKIAPKLIFDMEKLVETIIPEEYNGGPLKLNVGPGRWFRKGWKRLDCYNNLTNFDVDLRKMEKLPLEDNVIEKVFSSHCIEHIEDVHLDKLIKELYRCMKPGGLLRFSCPDADQALEAYRKGDKEWFFWLPENTLEKQLLNMFVSYERGGPLTVPDALVKRKFQELEKEKFIRWCVDQADRTRPYIAHINGHYYDKLQKKFADAGFVKIERSTYKGSRDKELREDDFDLYPRFSLYIECEKPAD